MMQVAGLMLIAIGLYGIVATKHVVRMILALNIMEMGAFIWIISIGYVQGGIAPIYTASTRQVSKFVDPFTQAMVLTAIVIGFGVTALSIGVARYIYKQHGTYDLSKIGGEV